MLCYKDCSTNRTLDTVGESRFGAGSGFAGDCFLGVFGKGKYPTVFLDGLTSLTVGKVQSASVAGPVLAVSCHFAGGRNCLVMGEVVPRCIDSFATVFRFSAQCAVTHFAALFRAGGRFYKPIAPLVHKNGAGNVFPVNFHHVFANFYKILSAQCAGVMFQPAFLRA